MFSSILISIGAFIVLLSIVVIVHEYGHYKTGRRLGIGVERFAIGFGPTLYKWQRDEVEFAIKLIPLGGYVKFVGDESEEPIPEELRDKAFNTAPVYKRVLVVVAGPVMNLVLAFVLFCVIFLIGFPAPAASIGEVDPDSPAAAAGLQPGDQVVAIDGHPIKFWQELSLQIAESPGRTLDLRVRRADRTLDLTVTPENTRGPDSLFLFETDRGSIGISPVGLVPLIGVAEPGSIAYRAGLRTGDLILSVNGEPVRFLAELAPAIARHRGEELRLEVARGDESILSDNPTPDATVVIPAAPDTDTLAALGVESGELYIYDVQPDSPAAAAGMESGDRILAIDEKPVTSWQEFTAEVRGRPDQSTTVVVRRAGQDVTLTVVPRKVETLNVMGEKETYGQVGIQRLVMFSPVAQAVERYWNPLKIVARGLEESWIWTVRIVKSIYYLFAGKVPASSLGGPIAIARLAGESAQMGLIQFLMFMAIISVNLAFINLLPIPVFDGGHVLLFTIEAIVGRPLGERAMTLATRVGLAFIAALFLLIFYNDFRWVFYKIKELLGT